MPAMPPKKRLLITVPQINEMQDKLKTAVLKGNRNGIVKITKEALESGEKTCGSY